MVALLAWLTWTGLRSRWQPTLLTMIVVVCAVGTATVARAVGAIADEPWERTFAATHGAHVIGIGGPGTQWQAVRAARDVSDAAGPLATAFASLHASGKRAPVLLREAPLRLPRIDRPVLVEGRWLRAREVVLEHSLARELDVDVGDRVQVADVAVRVAGTALTTSQQAFPQSQPGLVFATPATLRAAAPDPATHGSLLLLRIRDPANAEAFARRAAQGAGSGTHFQAWQKRRDDARAATRTNQVVLSFFTLFLVVISAAVIATLVSARVVERARTVATLCAVGCTPRQATAAFVTEQVAVGLVGIALGTALGTWLAPGFVARSTALLNVIPVAAVDWPAVLATGLCALALIASVAGIAAWRASRGAVIDGLRGIGKGPGSPSLAAQLADRLHAPVVATLAARDALSPRFRALLTVLALALTVATVVAVLAMEATLDADRAASAHPPKALPPLGGTAAPPAPYPVAAEAHELRTVVYGLSITLLAVGLANVLASAVLSMRERTRDIALLRALGATAPQVAGVVLGAQAVAAALAAAIGIPLGLIAFRLAYVADNGSAEAVAAPDAWQLLTLLPAAVAVAALVCLPAAALAHRVPPGSGLRVSRH